MTEILIVDDEPDVRESLRRVLEKAGFAIRIAASGGEALEQMRRSPVSLVITDIIMPGIDGIDAIAAIRAEFPQARIIAISGGGNFGRGGYQPEAITTSAYLAAAGKAGAHHVLTKPFDTAQLLDAVGRFVYVGGAPAAPGPRQRSS